MTDARLAQKELKPWVKQNGGMAFDVIRHWLPQLS
jgi:hypothetical protein